MYTIIKLKWIDSYDDQNKKWQNIFILSIILVILVAIVLHLAPSLALRTNIFFQGHFDEALHAKLTPVESEDSQSKLYTVVPTPFEKVTHSELKTFEVKKIFVFYSASYYGEV